MVDNGAFTDDPLRRRRATRVYTALLGQVPGVDLVSAPLRADMAAPASKDGDEVIGIRTTWAFGFSPQRPGGVTSRPGSTFA